MYVLWFLFMVDTLADGMVSMSLTSYYLDTTFHVPKSSLGDVFSAAYFLCAVVSVFASPLARHIGLVNTMVFTHIPSSAAVLLFPAARGIPLAYTLLLVRIGLNSLDQAPRAALIAAVVRPEERTAIMGVTSMLRTLSGTVGPTITGLLAGNDSFWIAFVAAGALRLAYDVGLFVMCINMTLYKHEPTRDADGATVGGKEADNDEEGAVS
jgi:MFS family permease